MDRHRPDRRRPGHHFAARVARGPQGRSTDVQTPSMESG
jgi:hypothetical protein